MSPKLGAKTFKTLSLKPSHSPSEIRNAGGIRYTAGIGRSKDVVDPVIRTARAGRIVHIDPAIALGQYEVDLVLSDRFTHVQEDSVTIIQRDRVCCVDA